jgi:hypothetical protein
MAQCSSKSVKKIRCMTAQYDRLCGLMVRVLGYRSGGPGSIPGTTRKQSSGSGTGSTQPREYSWGATWKKSSGSSLENREYGRRDPSRWARGTLYPQKLAITSPTSGGRSVGIVRSRAQTMEFVCCLIAQYRQCCIASEAWLWISALHILCSSPHLDLPIVLCSLSWSVTRNLA